MGKRKRDVAALGAAAFLLAGSAALAVPGSATADTVSGKCGSSVTGRVGDQLLADPSNLFLLPAGTLPKLNLGTISPGTRTQSKSVVSNLLTKVCSVTVTGLAPVESATKSVTDTAERAVGEGSKGVTDSAKAVEDLLSSGADPAPGDGGAGPGDGGGKEGGGPARDNTPPEPNSPATRDAGSYRSTPPSALYGSVPMMSGFSALPYYNTSMFSPAPGLRYGSGLPGYSPEFGILGQDTPGSSTIQNAGSADALPGGRGDIGLPVLLAVLTLAAASAGLVRTWVLRRAFA